jgi:hypothetical protein
MRTYSLSAVKGRNLKKTLTLPRAAISMASMASWRFLGVAAHETLGTWCADSWGDIPDVGTKNADTLDDGEEDGNFEIPGSWQADSHERSTGAEVVGSLGVTGGVGGSDDGGVGTEPASDALDVRNKALSLFKIYPSLCAEAEN